MQQNDYIAIIVNLEPDFGLPEPHEQKPVAAVRVVEEQIIEHYRLKFEGLVIAHQLDWWLSELRNLQSQLPLGYGPIEPLCEEAYRRYKAERGQ